MRTIRGGLKRVELILLRVVRLKRRAVRKKAIRGRRLRRVVIGLLLRRRRRGVRGTSRGRLKMRRSSKRMMAPPIGNNDERGEGGSLIGRKGGLGLRRRWLLEALV
jgi:hypothetical protein